MAIKQCHECNKEISDQAKACPFCGAAKPKSWMWLKLLIGLPIGLFVFMMIVGNLTSNAPMDTKTRDREAIKLCWEEQSRKSLDPATARFAASTCEMMEREFRGKHNAQP